MLAASLFGIIRVVELGLNVILAVLMIWAAIHATVTSSDAFTAFARWPRGNWLLFLWIGVLFTFWQGVNSVVALLALLGIQLPYFSGFVGPSLGGFFGVILFALPGVYFASEKPRLDNYKKHIRRRDQFGPTRGPRDW
ncbi:DUF2516 family protein [Actinomycetaceae bacterium TAE3-ERU4]|nr:DUF2516 family protein [Actinomycetaceae bacterium TAE3-ERU4]